MSNDKWTFGDKVTILKDLCDVVTGKVRHKAGEQARVHSQFQNVAVLYFDHPALCRDLWSISVDKIKKADQ